MALKAKHPISVSGPLIQKHQEVVAHGTGKPSKDDTRPRLPKNIIDELIAEGAIVDDTPASEKPPEKPPA